MARILPLQRIPRIAALALALAAGVALGCGSSTEGATPVDAGPPVAPDLLFDREGVPGPWWRRGATQEMFDAEHRVCLARSREARASAGQGDAAEAAYRSFLECMQQSAWNRGLPPRPS